MNPIFEGVATALYTPFSADGINYEFFENLLERQLTAKVDAVVVLGTTGEAPTVSCEERTELIKFTVSKIKGKIPIIVGCGSNCTSIACDLTKQAKELGADGALCVTPYYNKCEQDGLFLHFKEITEFAKFPTVCYNVPSRTGVNIEPETAKKLSALPFVAGFKEASSNPVQIERLFDSVQNGKPIYCGSDDLLGKFIKLGARGAISVASNVIPLKIKDFIRDFKDNYDETEIRFNLELSEFLHALFEKVNPIPVKLANEIINGETCRFRLPLTRPDEQFYAYLKNIINKLRI